MIAGLEGEHLLSVAAGLGLAAAVGFRLFLPFLILSIAAHQGWVEPASGFAWVGSTSALVVFATAAAAEVLAYMIPWFDNLLDFLVGPVTFVAGILAAAAVLTDLSPLAQWLVAILAGGATAGLVKTTAAVTRGASTATTGGAANPALATAETGVSAATSILAILAPLVVLVVVVVLVVWLLRRRRASRRALPPRY